MLRSFPLLVLGALTALLVPTRAQDPLSVHQMISMKQVAEVAVSPDGATTVFVRSEPRSGDESDGGAWRRLYALVPGGAPRPLVEGAVSVRALGFLDKGRRLAFLARLGGDKSTRLHAISPAGGDTAPLTPDHLPSISAWALSPDEEKIAIVATAAPSARETAERGKGFRQTVYEEDWKPRQLMVFDRGTGLVRRYPLEGSVHEIAFGPENGVLFLTKSPTPSVDDRYMRKDLFRLDLESGKAALLADVPGKLGEIVPSPDGKHVAFNAGIDIHDPSASSLFVVPSAGGEVRMLTPKGYKGTVMRSRWTAPGQLAVLAYESCSSVLHRVDAKTGNHAALMKTGPAAVTAFELAPSAMRLVAVASSPAHGREVYAGNYAESSPPVLERMTDSNPSLKQTALGEQSVIRWKARDGLAIEGLLIKPVGHRSGTRHPLIVVAHGGPESCYLNGWNTRYSDPGQVAAGQGYLLFYPNYRSSTGRGVAFSKAGQGDAGGSEFNDILDGIDHLVDEGLADPKRVGITGGSYGGYFSAWAATKHTHRFQAAVMFVGISHQVSKVGTTDIPQESYLSHWKVRPWDDLGLYLRRSPIMYTREAQTPILILHGKDDPRVSYTQSVELFRWLKLKGDVPVRLILYPGEGHGNRRRASQLDYALRLLRWFDHFLKQGGKEKPPYPISYLPR